MTCNARPVVSCRMLASADQQKLRASPAAMCPRQTMGCRVNGLRARRATATGASRSATAVTAMAAAKGYKVSDGSRLLIHRTSFHDSERSLC